MTRPLPASTSRRTPVRPSSPMIDCGVSTMSSQGTLPIPSAPSNSESAASSTATCSGSTTLGMVTTKPSGKPA